jgi:hypothetical protein
MAQGRDIQLARQIGEHLVAAELGRQGFVATPFAGNVPLFDLLAADLTGRAFSIQVKTSRGGVWQLQADKFINIHVDAEPDNEGKRNQRVTGLVPLPNPDVIWVFVMLHEKAAGKAPDFFVCTIEQVQAIVRADYKDGFRPKNPDSKHCTISPARLDALNYRDNWGLLGARFP